MQNRKVFLYWTGNIRQKEDGNNKCLSLPGSPMGDFGLLFGPREREKPLELSFSFYASKKGAVCHRSPQVLVE